MTVSSTKRPPARASQRTQAVPDGTRVRRMEDSDVEQVCAIEATSFTTPWKPATFRTLLGRPGAHLRVLEVPPLTVAGYAVLWCIHDQGELANIAVAQQLRDCCLGGYLLDRVTKEARALGVESLYLEVRVSNARASAMYASRGFREIGIRRDYYEKPREDARVLMKQLMP